MTDRLIALLFLACVIQMVTMPFLVGVLKRRRMLAPAPRGLLPIAGAAVIVIAGLVIFGYGVHRERARRHAEYRAFHLGEHEQRFLERWGPPSDDLPIEQLERKWSYRAVEERGDRRAAVRYLVWWGRLDIATARVVGFDRSDRAVLLSWGGT